jgi:hypothetical protein
MNSHNMSEMYITGKFKGMLFIVLMHSGIQVLIKVMCLNTFKTTVRNFLCDFALPKFPHTGISYLGVQQLF